MAGFANSASLVVDGNPDLGLAWIAGLLEAEGTFLRPVPSQRGRPIVACSMTDRDVVERLALMLDTTVSVMHRPPHKTAFRMALKGARAVDLMAELQPVMSGRRAAAIRAAVEHIAPSGRKLDYLAAEEIRDMHALGAPVMWLASVFGVARSTIRQVISESLYAVPPSSPWRGGSDHLEWSGRASPRNDITRAELYWLAGWLEGEGSFLRPPPSDPRRPRIVGETRDRDVAREVGRILVVTPSRSHPARARERGWSPTWRILRRGRRAISLMTSLYPLMGSRRQSQIRAALVGADLASQLNGGGRYCPGVREAVPM